MEGDSYGLPRVSRLTGCVCLDYASTYPYQLQRMLADKFADEVLLVNRCRHANTSYSLVTGEADEIEFLKPDLCVVQLGLTDLWPAKGRQVEPLQKELKKNDPWVSCTDYVDFIGNFVHRAVNKGSLVEIVGIPMVAPYHLGRHMGLETKIREYSLAVAEIKRRYKSVEYVNWTNIDDYQVEQPIIGEDGIHPTAYGSWLLAKMLLDGYCGLKWKGD